MTTRNLYYKHHISEIYNVPDDLLHLTAGWRTVPKEECELCQEGGGSDDASTLSGAADTLTDKASRNNKVVTLGT